MQNILVCHTGAWIGDMILLTPALRTLKQIYPISCLTLLLRPLVADLMRTNPYVDKCIVDRNSDSSYPSFISLFRQIHDNKFDIAVVLHPTSIRNALLPFIARIPIRVGSKYKGRNLLLTKTCENITDQHEVDRYLHVIKLLNRNTDQKIHTECKKKPTIGTHLEYWHKEDDRNTLQNILEKEGVSSEDRLIAVNIGTTWRTKQWDMRNFYEVINEISTLVPSIKFVLTGSSSEQALIDEFPQSNSVINLVGKTDIMQLGALIERCEICLTCDSGPMHIAAAVGTPTVALFGPTNPKRHRPYGIGHTIIEKPVSCRPCYKRTCHRQDTQHLCMQEINISEVVKALTTKLNQNNQ